MHTKRTLGLALAAILAVAACSNNPASNAPSAAGSAAPSTAASAEASQAAASPAPLAPDSAEAVIKNVEPNATIDFWTYYLSPTFDRYLKETIARFEQTYPGVKVNWQDHQGTFQEDLKAAFAAQKAPDVINLSVGEGWVSDYASKGLLLPLDDKVPQDVQSIYFPGLWKEQLVGGKNFQFPWYQSIATELINKRIYEQGAGLSVATFPKTFDELPGICKTILDKTGTVCDIRLSVNDLLAQMTYEEGVKILSADGKKFAFDSPEAVNWLKRYVQMVNDKSVDNGILLAAEDRTGLLLFSSGQAAFWQTAPNLIRDVKKNNATLYNDIAVVPAPVGKSGVVGKGSMGISVKADTKFPNASIALAQFFTNPRSMVAFSKVVSIYPSSPKAYDDPFFSSAATLVEDSARPIAKDIVSKYQDIVPALPASVTKADVNNIVLKAVQSALFGTPQVDPQKALSDAVAQANALIK
jgi:putative chitobiose transport system substrate-binding protein